ncbi:cobaltochelatase CobT-related protein [Streptomyces cavernicola]|uniref:Cobalt chelatase n=1 Tax=Streptomyces cavernicola TaxID=3043613 RepID=A0ABT6SCX6_9ACTN|nr:cobalt chelatase [Streptomyces sp. B-S-A6]MDI3405664.1 cobalt chelatase [Streptomyces sp. B-S-A6]
MTDAPAERPAEPHADARRRQRVEELCAAAVRALSADPDLRFRGRRLHRGRRPLPLHAPHLHPTPEDDFGSFRGAADGMALRLTRSDAGLHRRERPAEPVERLVFEMLEQFRVESLAPAAMPGITRNLRHRHEQWSLAFHRSGLTETARGLLLYTVAQVCRSRITAQPVVAETEDLIEATRAAVGPSIGHDLAGLRRHRADQAAFAAHALSLACTVAALLTSAEGEGGTGSGAGDEDARADDPDDRAEDRSRFTLLTDFGDDEQLGTASLGRSRVLEDATDGYRVFTTAYDRQHPAGRLVRPELLGEYRERLDRRIAAQSVNVGRLARALTALLADPARDGWDGGQEEGRVDGRLLARLISSPRERRLFRTERVAPVPDALVTFLVDCSGSMKEHGEPVAALVDVFARALEQAGVSCEILGYTTGAWNGGRARRAWLRAGRPAHPGRLNEQCHLVFKDAETPWRRARRDIAALLKADLYREGVDGEAVAWAARRAQARPERRRLLVVLSDGSPMDTATHLVNDRHYLDHHLKDVVAGLERSGVVEVHGLGVGLDLSPYYSRCHALDPSRTTGREMIRETLTLLAGHPRR